MEIEVAAACPLPRTVQIHREAEKPLLLIETEPWNVWRAQKTYDPQDRREPKLWEAVSKLAGDPSPEACAAFASEWGFLLEQPDLWPPPSKGKRASELPPFPGKGKRAPDRPLYWSQEIATWTPPLRMYALAVALFQAISTGTWHHLDFSIKTRAAVPDGEVYNAVVKLKNGSGHFTRTRHPTHKTAAAAALIEDLAIKGLSSTRLRWHPDRGVYGVANTPLACAWLQLLQEVVECDGGECRVCGKWITWDRRNPREKRFCSVRCRVAEHRKKKRR